jgi:leucine dehydrogenase
MSSLKDVATGNISSGVFEMVEKMGHEQVLYFNDRGTGLRGIIAIHDTTLGPSLGGCRIWNYKTSEDALKDVLRLSRGMTFKSAISGISLGGGKSVIISDNPAQRTDAFWKKFGEYVESLKGAYITAEDVGTSTKEIVQIMQSTAHVSGKPADIGGGGDPSPFTAYGVYLGMKAAANKAFGSDNLSGKKVVVVGVGHVGRYLTGHLAKDGAIVFVADIKDDVANAVAAEFGATRIGLDQVLEIDADIYAPCALGGSLNSVTIPQLKCAVIAGAANNQLEDEVIHGNMLRDRGIIYAPDFLINGGGVINCYQEILGYDRQKAMVLIENIYTKTIQIVERSAAEHISTHEAAVKIAMERIEQAR